MYVRLMSRKYIKIVQKEGEKNCLLLDKLCVKTKFSIKLGKQIQGQTPYRPFQIFPLSLKTILKDSISEPLKKKSVTRNNLCFNRLFSVTITFKH